MESATNIPDSLKSVSIDQIATCFQKFGSRQQNLQVKNPKSIYGKVACEITQRAESTFEERYYLNLIWKNCNKVNIIYNSTLLHFINTCVEIKFKLTNNL